VAIPLTKFVTTGHSLGGSTAVLLHILLRHEYPNIEIETFSFGAAPVISNVELGAHEKSALNSSTTDADELIAQATTPRRRTTTTSTTEITTTTTTTTSTRSVPSVPEIRHFVLNDDIVPTLSSWNLLRLLRAMKHIDELELTTWERLKVAIFTGGASWKKKDGAGGVDGHDNNDDRSTFPPLIASQSTYRTMSMLRATIDPLEHCGRYYRINTRGGGGGGVDGNNAHHAYYCEELDSTILSKAPISVVPRGAFLDHLPHRYEKALNFISNEVAPSS